MTAAVEVSERNLGEVVDPETREWYAETATRRAGENDPDEVV